MSTEPVEATLEVRSKPWWQSKTIIGAVAAILAAVLGMMLKTEVGTDELVEMLTGIVTVVGGILAIYGRVKADTQIEVRRATRATPEEIAQARGGRGGLNKGGVLVRLLVSMVFAAIVVAFLAAFSGCASAGRIGSHPTDQKRLRVLAADTNAPALIAEIRAEDFTPATLETARGSVMAQTVIDVPFYFGVGLVLWPAAVIDDNDALTKIFFPYCIVSVALQAQRMTLDHIRNLESAAR